ncbi:hypothetical protein OSTOST_24654, partial [Ostertagia ostertagi]
LNSEPCTFVRIFLHISSLCLFRINRARSDPAIHQMSMHMMTGSGGPMMFPHQMQAGPSGLGQMMPVGPQCSMPNNMVPQPGMVTQNQPMVGGPQQSNPQQGVQGVNMQSPLQSPLHYPMQGYGYPNGSPYAVANGFTNGFKPDT